ncbi:MAG: hypothetical protein IKG85_06090 [Clostridia bacterium]|nr:hypothetical protein [Clostridia bacterium]
MKRFAALLLASLVLLSFISCVKQTGSDEPAPDGAGSSTDEGFITIDRQGTFSDMLISPLIEANGTYYYAIGRQNSKVFFCDKESRDWMPLCFRPDCFHKTLDCNAYLGGRISGSTIWAYGKYIYYVLSGSGMTPSLWRMKLDGSEHERVLAFDYEKENDIYNSFTWDFYFHNKYLYAWFWGSNEELAMTPRGFETLIFLVDLSRDKPQVEQTSFTYDTGMPFCGKDNIVYCWNTPNNNSIVKADLETGSWEKLCEFPFYPTTGFILKDDRLYAADSDKLVYVDTNTGEIATACTLESGKHYKLTEEYIIGGRSGRKAPTETEIANGRADTLIYDFEGNLVRRIPYGSYGMDIGPTFSSGNIVFGTLRNNTAKEANIAVPEWYLDLSEVGDPDMTWRRWAPDGE